MALRVFDFETGPSGADLTGSTTTGGNSGASQITTNAGTAKFSTRLVRSGSLGARFVAAANALTIGRFPFSPVANNTQSINYAWTLEATPATTTTVLTIRFNGGVAARLNWNTDNSLSILDTGNANPLVLATGLTPGNGYEVSFRVKSATSTTGTITAVLYNAAGTQIGSASSSTYNLGTAALTQVDVGVVNTNPAAGTAVALDYLQMDDGSITELRAPQANPAYSGTGTATATATGAGVGSPSASGTSATSATATATGSGSVAASGVAATGATVTTNAAGTAAVSGTGSSAPATSATGTGSPTAFGSSSSASSNTATATGTTATSGTGSSDSTVTSAAGGTAPSGGTGTTSSTVTAAGAGAVALRGAVAAAASVATTTSALVGARGAATATASVATSALGSPFFASDAETGASVVTIGGPSVAAKDVDVAAWLLPRRYSVALRPRRYDAMTLPSRWKGDLR